MFESFFNIFLQYLQKYLSISQLLMVTTGY